MIIKILVCIYLVKRQVYNSFDIISYIYVLVMFSFLVYVVLNIYMYFSFILIFGVYFIDVLYLQVSIFNLIYCVIYVVMCEN